MYLQCIDGTKSPGYAPPTPRQSPRIVLPPYPKQGLFTDFKTSTKQALEQPLEAWGLAISTDPGGPPPTPPPIQCGEVL